MVSIVSPIIIYLGKCDSIHVIKINEEFVYVYVTNILNGNELGRIKISINK